MKLTAILVATALAASPVGATDLDAVRKIVTDPKAAAAPGCVVGAFKGGKTLFTTAAGLADISTGKPLDADTLLYAASVAKQFTSLAAVQLAVQGKIDLDGDIRKYIPELPAFDAPVTPRMLMQHTSGIRDSLALLRWAGVEGASQATKAQTLDLVLRQKSVNFTPGTQFNYSNGGYLLLAEIVERVSGMPFSEYAGKHILKPIGMKSSLFMNDKRPDTPQLAHGYLPKGDSFEVRNSYPYFSGSGGLLVTINDLAKYDYDIEVGHKVWTPEVRAIMLKPGTFTNGEPALRTPGTLVYAGGLMIGPRRGQNVVQHAGGAETFKTQYTRIPDRRLGVVVFCNRGDWNPAEKADDIIELIEGDILTDELAPLAGRYRSDELQSTYDLAFNGDTLTAAISSPYAPTGAPIEFQRAPDGSYRGDGVTLTFVDGGKGFTLSTARILGIPFTRVAE